MNFDFRAELEAFLGEATSLFDFCGHVSKGGTVRPLRSDSKVLAALFEDGVCDRLRKLAEAHGFTLETPPEQNYYPDFTLTRHAVDGSVAFRAAVDIKTTYVNALHERFKFTLGSHAGYLQKDTPEKNCHYPYPTYDEHWVVGFVYQRVALEPGDDRIYALDELDKVPLPFTNVRYFVQEKWRIAGDKAGSGNTGNIGSVEGVMDAFVHGQGVFASYREFLAYWRNFGKQKFRNIGQYRVWSRTAPAELVDPDVVAEGQLATTQFGLF